MQMSSGLGLTMPMIINHKHFSIALISYVVSFPRLRNNIASSMSTENITEISTLNKILFLVSVHAEQKEF